jgi:hypothetical protein
MHVAGRDLLFTKVLPILCPPFTLACFNDANLIEWCGPLLARGRRRIDMLETIVVVLLILWVLGMVSSTTMGGLIHVLLVIAVVVVLLRLIQGRTAF